MVNYELIRRGIVVGWLQAGYENEEEGDGGVVRIQTDHGGGVHGHVPPGLWVNASESGEDLVRLSFFFFCGLLFFRSGSFCYLRVFYLLFLGSFSRVFFSIFEVAESLMRSV